MVQWEICLGKTRELSDFCDSKAMPGLEIEEQREKYAVLIGIIGQYGKIGMYEEAAELAQKLGLKKQAEKFSKQREIDTKEMERCEESKHFCIAARIAQKLDLTEKAKELYQKEIEYDERKGFFYEAARIAEEIGMLERAVDFYEKGGEKDTHSFYKAALIARKLGLYRKERELLEKW